MQILAFALLMSIVLLAAAGSKEYTTKTDANMQQIVTNYADLALNDAEASTIADLKQQVQQAGTDGPFNDPAVASPAPACPQDEAAGCPYTRQIVVHYTGSIAAGGAANDVANNLNRYPTLDQSVAYAQLTARIYQSSNTNGQPLAVANETLTLTTKATPPYVLSDGVNSSTSKTELDAEHDNAGCDPASPASCGQAGNATPAKTTIENLLRCADDGNPAHGLCGPATPRPADNFQTIQTHSGNVQ